MGVFVNPTLDELAAVLQEVPLAVVQLHGQETPEFCRQVRERFSVEVWKALAVGGEEDAARAIGAYQGIVSAFCSIRMTLPKPGNREKVFVGADSSVEGCVPSG